MSSDIIVASPKKSVAPSKSLKKASGNLYNIEAPVVMIIQKDSDNKR